MAFEPAGSVCVVTGGGSGIGSALCRELAARGAAHVVVADLSLERARAVEATLPAAVGHAQQCDVAKEMDIRQLVVTTESMYGPITLFCSNAGIPSNGGPEVSNDEWERNWRTNVLQGVFVARHLFPLYESRGVGALLVTSSAAGLLSQVGALPYTVTKHAAVALAEWLAITYKCKGISVSCLCPQAVSTGMLPAGTDGGPAGVDGVLTPEQVASETVDAMVKGVFLILPHKKVATHFLRRATDHERWLNGMAKLHTAFGELVRRSPNISAAKL
ncbi:hypothetical protein AB1Y20_012944 [Prymnesium parvum]|uniref:Ketoreductase domain-containing protein n=1 Tax=Prymnesium parvum TaxID=97485 RepID=A0AB34ILZ9_PRYPA